jgi:four helix bundle protein
MTEQRQYDLAERTATFAMNCRTFIHRLPKTISNIEDSKQLARSSGSVAANYLEADEALSKKDFALRIKICRKEARESRLWLGLVSINPEDEATRVALAQEAYELVKICNAIVAKS